MKMFLFVLTFVFFIFSQNIVIVFSQTIDKSEKIITKESFKNEPIEIFELKSDEKTVKLKESFVQENDWLKDFTLKFRNVSGKSIVYVSTVIGFPETDSTGNRMVYYLKYGVNPLVKNNTKDEPELLAPDETAKLLLSVEKYTKLKNFLATRRHWLKDLTEIHLTIVSVYFDDGTHWSAGTTFRPDTNRPGKFIAVDENNQK